MALEQYYAVKGVYWFISPGGDAYSNYRSDTYQGFYQEHN